MAPLPHILALETSGRTGSVAVARGPELLATCTLAHTMRHASELMPAIAKLCAAQSWSSADLHQLYVSTGPGSFTGLRVAISIARALAQATGCQLVAVPTLDVIALNAPPEADSVVVLLDAKRGQVFAARYLRRAAALERRSPPALVAPAQIVAEAAKEGGPVWVLGEGVDYHRAALLGAGADVREVPRELWPARAAGVHQIGYGLAAHGAFTPRDALLPAYLRLAEAEELWRKRHGLPA